MRESASEEFYSLISHLDAIFGDATTDPQDLIVGHQEVDRRSTQWRGRPGGWRLESRPHDDAWLTEFSVLDESLSWDKASHVSFGEAAEGISGVARPVVQGLVAERFAESGALW